MAFDQNGFELADSLVAGVDENGFELAEPAPFDFSKIKPSPHEVLTPAGTKPESGMEAGTSFLEAAAQDPVGFIKTAAVDLPFTVAAVPGKLAYLGAADVVSKIAGQPEYGGNLTRPSFEPPPDRFPAEQFIYDAAKDSPKLATASNVARAIPELASMMAVNPSGAAGRLIALGFSADMVAHSGPMFKEYAAEYYKPENEQDKGKMAELEAGIIQTLVFAPLAGAHGGSRIAERAVYGKGRALGRELSEQIDAAGLEPKTYPARPLVQPDIRGEPIPGLSERLALMDRALQEAQSPIVVAGRVPAIELLRRQETDQIVPAGAAGVPISLEGGGEAPFGKVSYMRKAEAPTTERTQQALRRGEIPPEEPPAGGVTVPAPTKPTPTSPEQISKETGFDYDAKMEAMVPNRWHFTDRRKGSPTESASITVPKDATAKDVTDAFSAWEKANKPPKSITPLTEAEAAVDVGRAPEGAGPTMVDELVNKPTTATPAGKEAIRKETPAQEFDRLIVEHGPEFGWKADWDTLFAGKPEKGRTSSTMEIEGSKKYSKAIQGLRRYVASELDLTPGQVDTPAGRAKALDALRKHIEERNAPDNVEPPPGASTDFFPPETPTPKLGAMEKGTGDLLKGQSEDFALTGEKGTDVERIAAAKAKASKDAAEAKAIADKQQQQIPGLTPTPPAAGEGGAKPGIISGTALESWATDRIIEGKKRLTTGIDPELMTAYAIKGAAYLERGVRDFAKWSGEMVKEYGEDIKPHLRRIYAKANSVFLTPGRYAVEEGKLKIVSEQEVRRMERAVKLSKNIAGVKDQLDLFDREIGEALTEGGRFLPKDLRPEVAKGSPAEKRTVTNKEINQYFVNQLVTVRKAMQKLKTEMTSTADTASLQYFDLLQKHFELSFRKVQELRRTSHEALYFWNAVKGQMQDIARMAGQMPEIKRRLPIIDQLVKDLRNKEFAKSGKDFVDYLRVNLFTPFSFTLDFTSNLLAVAAHTPAWLAMDMAHLVTGKPMTRTASALRALKLSGKNAIPGSEKFRLPEEVEIGLGTTAGGEFQGLPKEVMVDFSEILKGNPKLAGKLKNLDYVLGGPVRMKRAVDNFFGRFGATAELYNAAYQAGRGKGLKGDLLNEFVEQFILNPPESAVAQAIKVGGEFKFNRELPAWAERFANNTVTKLAVEAYPRWTLQFTKWAGEMIGVDPGFIRKAVKGDVTAEQAASYLAKAATGWGALYAFNQLFYNQVDPNTMEYVNEKGDRIRLSGRQPFPELYMLTALFRGDIDNAKAAFPYTSIPFAGLTGGQGGLLSPIIQTMIESWKGNYTAEQTSRELTKTLNNALPGKSVLGLIRAIYDPTIREGVGAPIPGVASALPTKVNITTGEPAAPKQRIPGTGILLPTVGGTPFPGAVRVLNPIEKVLLNHGISNVRPRRTSLIELPAEEVPKELRREYEQRVGKNVKEIIGEAIKSKDWAELSGKENFETRRELLMSWMNLARSISKAELAEKYNKSMGSEKTTPMMIKRLPDFVKDMPAKP